MHRIFGLTLVLLLVVVASNSNSVIANVHGDDASGLEVGVLVVHARNHESNSSLIGLCHLLDEVGVSYQLIEPNTLTHEEIVRVFPAIITDSYLGSGTLHFDEMLAITEYVQGGGILVAVKPEGSVFASVFGFSSRRISKEGFFLEWRSEALSTNLLLSFDQPEERRSRLTTGLRARNTISVVFFTPSTAQPIAYFLTPDGVRIGAGILRNTYGRGVAYAIGTGWTDSILRFEIQGPTYGTNIWRPDADVMRLFVLSALRMDAPNIIIKNTVPFGYKSALVLSHDVDARSAYDTWALEMARMEKARSVSATYFLTTRYFKDNIDVAYWNPETVKQLRSLGMTIGSHGVTHYENLTVLPPGNNEETQSTYIPHSAPTLTGEIRVSAEMLRAYAPVNSWRSPGLLDHQLMTFYLERNGYEFRSGCASASVGTNYPYVAMLNRSLNYESSIFEFPVAIGDIGLNATNMDSYVEQWKEIIRENRDNGAPTAILVHPTSAAKVTATKDIIEWALLEGDIWVTDCVSFMQFWKLRQNTILEAQLTDGTYVLRLTNLGTPALQGLSLVLPGTNGTLQVPCIPAYTCVTLSVSLDMAHELMVFDASAQLNRTRASVEVLEVPTASPATDPKEIASAKQELTLAMQLLQTSPNEALKHARIGQAHLTLATAFGYMIQEEPDEEPLAPAVRLFAIYFDTIDYLLILANAILYGVVFVMRRNRKNTDL